MPWPSHRQDGYLRRAWAAAARRGATDGLVRCFVRAENWRGSHNGGCGGSPTAERSLDGRVVAEAINRNIRDDDVTRHAEVIALSRVQKAISREQLRRCTLYTNVKPCAMCYYCIREAWVGRVVYAIESPAMGGLSKWNILRDDGISDIPQIFGAVPEAVSGVLLHQAQQVWRDWNPLAWQMIKLRGLLTEPSTNGAHIHVRPAHGRSLWRYLQMLLVRTAQPRIETEAPDVNL
jgi:tRNA(adenine34) deaminase